MTKPAISFDIRRDIVALLPRLRRFALTLTASPPAADELLREAAMQAVQKSHHWKGEDRLEAWLFSLMRSIWAEDGRKGSQSHAGTPPSASSVPAVRSGLSRLLAMPPIHAAALLMTDVEGFAYDEAASILGIDAGQLAAHLCAARLDLATDQAPANERRA